LARTAVKKYHASSPLLETVGAYFRVRSLGVGGVDVAVVDELARPVAGDDARAEVRRDELQLGRVGVEREELAVRHRLGAAGGDNHGAREMDGIAQPEEGKM
jgi:hypothetical protein